MPTTDGRAPAFLAAAGGHLPTLRLLLDAVGPNRRTEMSRPDSAGRTPVMAASANGHLGCLHALIEGTDSDGEDVGGAMGTLDGTGVAEEETAPAWERATQMVPREAVSSATKARKGLEFFKRGVLTDAEIDTPDSEGRTALMHACMFDQVWCG